MNQKLSSTLIGSISSKSSKVVPLKETNKCFAVIFTIRSFLIGLKEFGDVEVLVEEVRELVNGMGRRI